MRWPWRRAADEIKDDGELPPSTADEAQQAKDESAESRVVAERVDRVIAQRRSMIKKLADELRSHQSDNHFGEMVDRAYRDRS